MHPHNSHSAYENSPLILIVDDVPENVEILHSVLKDNNYRFAVALNAAETYKTIVGDGAQGSPRRDSP